MTLVSHRYKFIYMKTRKTAGSSVWAFMKPYCLSPEDQESTAVLIKEKANDAVASPYGILSQFMSGNKKVTQTNPLKSLMRIPCTWPAHKLAISIRRDLGGTMFNEYFKFCVVRNPWDRLISHWHWDHRNQTDNEKILTPARLESFIKKETFPGRGLSEIYAIKKKATCDFYIRYEHLKSDLQSLLHHLRITQYNIDDLPCLKSDIRTSSGDYQQYYTPKSKALIKKLYRSEIEQFEYEF